MAPLAEREFGPRLRSMREEQNVSLVALAARAGISRVYLSRVEHGQQEPSVSIASRLVHALGLTAVQQRSLFFSFSEKIQRKE